LPIKKFLIKVIFIFHKLFASDNELGYFFSSNQGNLELHYIYHTHMTNHTKGPCISIQSAYRTGQADNQICEQFHMMR
jgi:hypothetical protein